MLNNYNNQQFSYNINAVSGTLRKSHPKSQFTLITLSQTHKVFNTRQPTVFVKRNDYDGFYKNIIVLQVMLCGDNEALIEFVNAEDFESEVENDG